MDNYEIIEFYKNAATNALVARADQVCRSVHGDAVWLRGLIEFSNHCVIDCLYCGIRRSNNKVNRYRLTEQQIVETAQTGFKHGLRSFVLQSGEDPFFTVQVLCRILEKIKILTNDEAAITLSCGIRKRAEYLALKSAGADRYLIRFETSDPQLHETLRNGISLKRRLQALYDLKELGYQTGSGYMVGLPGETEEIRINNALLCHELQLDMVGIGAFIPHPDTPLGNSSRNRWS